MLSNVILALGVCACVSYYSYDKYKEYKLLKSFFTRYGETKGKFNFQQSVNLHGYTFGSCNRKTLYKITTNNFLVTATEVIADGVQSFTSIRYNKGIGNKSLSIFLDQGKRSEYADFDFQYTEKMHDDLKILSALVNTVKLTADEDAITVVMYFDSYLFENKRNKESDFGILDLVLSIMEDIVVYING